MRELSREQRLLDKCCNLFFVHVEYHVEMSNKSIASDFRSELESLAEIEVLENEEMWSSRVIDEDSRKQSIPGVIIQLPLQDNPTKC